MESTEVAFLDLSVELLLLVGGQLDNPKVLFSLVLVNKYTCSIYLSQLDNFSVQYEHSLALIWAAQHGKNLLAGRLLLHPRVLVNTVDTNHRTPIFHAVCSRNLEILHMLLSQPQANMHLKDKEQKTAIHLATTLGFQDVLELLAFHGANFNIKDGSGQDPLHYAASSGQKLLVRQLLAYEGTSARAVNKNGLKPVHLAITAKSFAIMKILVAHEHGLHGTNAAFNLSAEFKMASSPWFARDMSLTKNH